MKRLAVAFLVLAFLIARTDVAPVPTPMVQSHLPLSRRERRDRTKPLGTPYYAPIH